MANPSRSRLRWTEEDLDILKQLWPRRDITDEDISRVLKRSYWAIVRKTAELGLESRRVMFAGDLDREYLKQLMEVVDG